MGGGIAYQSASSKIPVVMKDIREEARLADFYGPGDGKIVYVNSRLDGAVTALDAQTRDDLQLELQSVFARTGTTMPAGLVIEKRKIRGFTSNGMLCSEEELGLAKSSEGLLILPPNTERGKPLAQLLGRDDVILTLKLTANRADCLSHWGLAREIASGTGAKLRKPAQRRSTASTRQSTARSSRSIATATSISSGAASQGSVGVSSCGESQRRPPGSGLK